MKLLLLSLLAASMATAQAPSCEIAPGWKQEGPARTFVPGTLFEYMNGNAEGYLIYQFVRLNGITCKSGENEVVVDVFEMATPESAYGIFAANRDARQPIEKIGMIGQVVPQRAVFAKEKYYVELAASSASDQSALLRSMAAEMEKRIEGGTELPPVLSWFPAEGLVADSIRLVPQSLLGFRILRRGFLAQYDSGKAFIIAEDSPEQAAAVVAKFRERIGNTQPAGIGDGGFKADDKYLGGLCVFSQDRYVAGFANMPAGKDPARAAAAIAARLPKP
ncbi:MAG: hypothetical protein HUU41_15035 [Bryobacteraceae bacterium]|nr:hypothetical protein [Bryobacterales bacterium]NUN02425.1 hypothetical protein [Bryobacteraceae bacterium]